MTQIKLIVGLGNIGNQYTMTRHNVGQWFLKKVSQHMNAPLKLQKKFYGFCANHIYNNHKIYLFYPNTYMNNSGFALSTIVQFYKIYTNEILVIHDDLDLSCGIIRLKKSGNSGGHNGLKDIQHSIQSQDFYRLRIGIGHPGHNRQVSSYVLTNPSLKDKTKIDHAIDYAMTHINNIIITDKHQLVMNYLHKKNNSKDI